MAADLHRVLVLGLGNILLGDEGLGVRAVERLQARFHFPEEVQVMDGGVAGLDLLPYLEGVTHLLVVDAVRMGAEPGTLVRLEGESLPLGLPMKLSVHQVGLHELLLLAHLQEILPPRVVVWGMEPAALEPGLELSPAVEAGLEGLVQAVADELRDWGVIMEPK
ncbi:MAG: HyaD/HybD family hydrogenase maturation endopeptidase [Caldilineales bacterium]|nr:HyaD/HybD family hydrogenase maturation endopeptidase [Caldilineales bacterium]